jgi:hypothetical protein
VYKKYRLISLLTITFYFSSLYGQSSSGGLEITIPLIALIIFIILTGFLVFYLFKKDVFSRRNVQVDIKKIDQPGVCPVQIQVKNSLREQLEIDKPLIYIKSKGELKKFQPKNAFNDYPLVLLEGTTHTFKVNIDKLLSYEEKMDRVRIFCEIPDTRGRLFRSKVLSVRILK